MSEFIKILDEAAGKAGFNLTPIQLEQFDTYYRMLVETNKVMNLTALTEPQDVAVKHFVDSLMAYDFLKSCFNRFSCQKAEFFAECY